MGPARARRSVEARRASFFVHAKAICESKEVGGGTRIWAFAHVLDGARIGEDCNIGEQVFVESGATIGNRVTVKNQVQVWEGVEIGDDVFVGPGVTFANDRFPRSPRMAGVPAVAERYKNKACWLAQTRVLRGATLGAGAVVCPGLVIGEYAMIGAGAVVTSDVGPHELVLGCPARSAGYVCRCGFRLSLLPDGRLLCRKCQSTHLLRDLAKPSNGSGNV